jgi:hypothetical protein
MATATTPTRTLNLAEAQQQVRHPLERLRGYIRAYVSLEGAAVVAIFLALWFWIGVLLDYGMFKIFGVDWVQELHWGFRAGVLCALVAAVLAVGATIVLTRLFREFRDAALALVLERRFPKQLGDRLITAVELADPQQAAAYGYSPAMVRATIHEAAQRVSTLPVKEVFDWKRLLWRGFGVFMLTVVCYLVAVAGFVAIGSIQHGQFSMDGMGEFHDVAELWFERNVLLQDTIWPRRAQLELIDFPDSGEVRIGRGASAPTIRARAFKYVIAGPPSAAAVNAYRLWLYDRGLSEGLDARVAAFTKVPPEGWRPLCWFDLTPELLGAPVPEVKLPDWKPLTPSHGPTLDEIELNLGKPETHQKLDPTVHKDLRDVLEKIDGRAHDPALRRRLRALTIPTSADLVYKGRTTSGKSPMQRLADNEYSGTFGELRESITFTVQGEDYSTASRRVTVVEPPTLDTLTREEERPAYLYFRPGPGVKPTDIRGKKQKIAPIPVSLQGGEVSRIEPPAGTDLTLVAVASKDLKSVTLEPMKADKPVTADGPNMNGEREFRTRFVNIRTEQAFVFKFIDTDGVSGEKRIVIAPVEDAPPKLRELGPDEIIRRVKEGYMVAVNARIPFRGKISDDYGLTDVRYTYTIRRLESTLRGSDRLRVELFAKSAIGFAPNGLGTMSRAAGLAMMAQALDFHAKVEAQSQKAFPPKSQSLPRFQQLLREKAGEFQPLEQIDQFLSTPQKLPFRTLINEFNLQPDKWEHAETDVLGSDFPLWKENLKVTDPKMAQPRYMMDLRVEAVDTDLDGAVVDGQPQPHVKPSDERFPFVIVSETELLAEIAKEEEKLYNDLESAVAKLLETEAKLGQVVLDLASDRVKMDELGPMSIRCEQIIEALEKGEVSIREVATPYEKILRELKTNQVDPQMVDRIKGISAGLDEASGLFDKARDSVQAFRRALDTEAPLDVRLVPARPAGALAKEQIRTLIAHLNNILGKMGGLIELNKIIANLAKMEKEMREQWEMIKARKEYLEEDLFKGLGKPKDKPKEEKPKDQPKSEK